MKKLFWFLCVSFFLFGIIGTANAALVDQNNGTILDNVKNQLWYQDLSDFMGLSFEASAAAIGASTFAGGGWHMASESEMNILWAHPGQDIVDAFIPAQSLDDGSNVYDYYEGWYNKSLGAISRYTIEWIAKDGVAYFTLGMPGTIRNNFETYHGAWATKAVPIPGAAWLLGSGLIGLAGFRRKFKK